MSNRQRYIIINDRVRMNALAAVKDAEPGYVVTVSPAKRSLDQNAMFHAICADMAKAGAEWYGKKRNAEEWKVLLISGHTMATKGEVEIVPGLEGEFLNVRESSASMTISRAASLITYAIAFCDLRGIPLTETRRCGFMEDDRSAA